RVLRPGGVAVLVWNTLDVRVPWVHRLTRIMHAGDVQKPGFVPDVAPPLRIDRELRLEWEQRLTPEQIILLARTRSYWLRAKDATREKVEANLGWYLYDHLGFAPGEKVGFPTAATPSRCGRTEARLTEQRLRGAVAALRHGLQL